MFGFLKDKLKGALQKFSKEVEEEAQIEEVSQEEPTIDEQEETTQTKQVHFEEEKETPIPKKTSQDNKEEEKSKEKLQETQQKKEESKPEDLSLETKVEPESAKEEFKEEQTNKEDPKQDSTISQQEKKNIISESSQENQQQDNQTQQVSEEQIQEKKGFLGKIFSRKQHPKPQPQEDSADQKESKEGLLQKLTKITLSEKKFEELFWELEVALLENNVAVEVIQKIKEDLQDALTQEKISRRGVEGLIKDTLQSTILNILSVESIDLLKKVEEKQSPLVIAMIGVNGSGKTTTLAKLTKYFLDHNKTVVVAAADTFRAAAIAQVEEHTTKLGVKLIKHDYNADPAAVAYDAIKHAKAKDLDVVLIDSAGRLHSNDNLMNELKKLIRINQPDIKIFVGEAITGNDCVEQATLFDQAVGIDGIILAKADVDQKGGAALSASFVTKKPVLFLGTGQGYDDLVPFNPKEIVQKLGF